MANFRWQYESLIEPVSQAPETTRPDKWHSAIEQPRRLAKFATAVYAASLFFVPVLVEAVPTVVQWQPQINEPVRVVREITRYEFTIDPTFLTEAEVPLLNKWYVPLSEPVRAAPEIVRYEYVIDPLLLTQSENITLDKWYVPLSEPIRAIPEIVRYAFTIDPTILTQAEGILLDKWFFQLPEQILVPNQATPHLYPYLEWTITTPVSVEQGSALVFTSDEETIIFTSEEKITIFTSKAKTTIFKSEAEV